MSVAQHAESTSKLDASISRVGVPVTLEGIVCATNPDEHRYAFAVGHMDFFAVPTPHRDQ